MAQLRRVAPPMASSPTGHGASAVACSTSTRSQLAPIRMLGISLPHDHLWYIRASFNLLYWGRNGDSHRPSDGKIHCFCKRRPAERLQRGSLSRDYSRTRRTSAAERLDHLFCFQGVAGRNRGTQRTFCHQSQHTVDSLEKGLHTDGGSCRICLQPPTRRFSSLHGHQEWIPTFSTRPSNEGLVYLPLRRQVLPVRSIALWMGQIATLVHPLHVGTRPGVAPLEYSGATLSR